MHGLRGLAVLPSRCITSINESSFILRSQYQKSLHNFQIFCDNVKRTMVTFILVIIFEDTCEERPWILFGCEQMSTMTLTFYDNPHMFTQWRLQQKKHNQNATMKCHHKQMMIQITKVQYLPWQTQKTNRVHISGYNACMAMENGWGSYVVLPVQYGKYCGW